MSGTHGKRSADVGHAEKFRRLVEVGMALTLERDVNVLLDRILTEARLFTAAEAGTLYLVTPDRRLQFGVVQNDRLGHSEVFFGKEALSSLTMEISPTSIAGRVTGTGEILNISDVYSLPEGCGYQFDSSFDVRTGYRSRSMLVVPMRNPDGKIMGGIQLINALCLESGEVTSFPAEQEELVLCLASQAAVALNNAQLTGELRRAYSEAIHRLARTAEFRDHDTGSHIERVSRYSALLAEALGLSPAYVSDILLASTLHDIGKLAIPDRILQKPGKLTNEEYGEMKCHAALGAEILSGSENPVLVLAREIALTHHEHWDGSGYPNGLRGDEIPLAGQICAVADVFDALSSARCYKKAFDPREACEFIRKESGGHFSPRVVEAFFLSLEKILEVRGRYPS